jgi:Domain of unknown function (DUF6443)/PKD-like domain
MRQLTESISSIRWMFILILLFCLVRQHSSWAQCPVPNQSTNGSSSCGGSITMNVTTQGVTTSSLSHRWYDASTGGNLVATTTASQVASQVWTSSYTTSTTVSRTFYVSSFCNSGESSSRRQVTATVTSNGSLSILTGGVPPYICIGNSITLTPSGGTSTSYSWSSNPPGASGSDPITVSPTVNTTYTLTGIESVCNTFKSTSLTINVSPKVGPVTINGGPGTICQGTITSDYDATATNLNYFSWSLTPSTAGSIDIATGVVTWNSSFIGLATVAVTAFSGSNCNHTTQTSILVTVNPLPVITNLPASMSACSNVNVGATISFTPIADLGGTTYSWTNASSGGITGASPTFGSGSINQTVFNTGSSPGTVTYTFTPSLNGCPGVAKTYTATINPLPIIGGITDQSICSEQRLLYNLISQAIGTSYSWTQSSTNVTGAYDGTGNVIDQTLTSTSGVSTGTVLYSITGTTGLCTGLATPNVTVKPVPIISNLSSSVSACSNSNTGATISFLPTANISGTTYNWNNAVTGGITGATPTSGTGGISQTVFNTGSSAGTVTYSFTPSLNGCTGVAKTYTATINPLPIIWGIADQSICSGQRLLYNLSSQAVGTTYSWTQTSTNVTGANNGTGSVIDQALVSTDGYSIGTVSYSVLGTAGLCTGSASANVTVKPTPTLSSPLNPSPIASGALFIYIPTSNTLSTSFSWSRAEVTGIKERESSGTSNISETLTNKTPGSIIVTYSINLTANSCTTFSQSVFAVVHPPLYPDENYIISKTVMAPNIMDEAVVEIRPITDVSKVIQYFDGLGRPMQTVVTKGSPSGTDIVQPIVYDAFGREAKKYLPFTSGSNGWYKPNNSIMDGTGNYIGIAQPFYATGSDNKIADDPTPYSETKFEPSPLNRILEQGAPGAAWQPGTGHTITKHYEFNALNDVFLFNYNTTTGELTLSSNVATKYYLPNQLYANRTTDEHNNDVIEYVDKEGHTVCKKVQYGTDASGKLFASTYYIYDDFGSLVVVLPPEAVKQITQN